MGRLAVSLVDEEEERPGYVSHRALLFGRGNSVLNPQKNCMHLREVRLGDRVEMRNLV